MIYLKIQAIRINTKKAGDTNNYYVQILPEHRISERMIETSGITHPINYLLERYRTLDPDSYSADEMVTRANDLIKLFDNEE